jgi:PhzF family phenazine biosynthesis protein
MTTRRFAQIDVFATRTGDGNPVAVVLDAEGLDTAAMQRFAAWTGLAETTFVLTPAAADADFRMRVFTTREELPFAGHPAVGTVYAVVQTRPDLAARTRLALECAAGVLPVRLQGAAEARRIFVQAPPARLAAPAGLTGEFAAAVGTAVKSEPAPHVVDVGPVWLIGELADAAVLRALEPDFARLAPFAQRHGALGIGVFARERSGETDLAVRVFCPGDDVPEDPVTGSANAAIAALLRATGTLDGLGPRYRASQGREVGRDGRVDVEIDAGQDAIWIGGHCAYAIAGHVHLDAWS